ncbi:MAG: NusG domain II-containing protein [Oscillospiraceae bacterium]|nr:NusG domain II-containing protein [Oscillospiraceae bacterium]
MKHRFRNDILLFAIIIAIALLSIFVGNCRKASGSTVLIALNGSTYAEIPLSKNVEIDVDGILTVIIEGGEVWVEDSTCPDGLCEGSGKISRSGESIVCLPGGVTVKITSSDPEYDFIN